MTTPDDASEPFGVDPAEVAGSDLIDVRRVPAFNQSPHLLPTAVWRDPSRVDDWVASLDRARAVVVYCVHGHEVSRGTATRLRAEGVNARFLRGGFEAWRVAGLPLVSKGAAP